jgi:hypothetical protein
MYGLKATIERQTDRHMNLTVPSIAWSRQFADRRRQNCSTYVKGLQPAFRVVFCCKTVCALVVLLNDGGKEEKTLLHYGLTAKTGQFVPPVVNYRNSGVK